MTILWLVEFKGEVKRLEEIEAPEFHSIIADSRQLIESSIAGSEDDLAGLKIIYFVEEGQGWGFKLAGPPFAVNLAKDLIGNRRALRPVSH